MQFLYETEEGQAIVKKFDLDLAALAGTLVADKIFVEFHPEGLRDWKGSKVDATSEPGNVTLDHDVWKEHFDSGRDVYYLVLHEMSRESGHDDENYRISKHIRPFPWHKKHCDCPDDRPGIQNPVWLLRRQFRLSKRPSEADLRLGKQWTCVHYSANKNDKSSFFHHNELRFKTTKQAPFVYKSTGGKGSWSGTQLFSRSYDPIRDTFGELQTMQHNKFRGNAAGSWIQTVRVNKKGDLLIERTGTNPQNLHLHPLRGVADCRNRVISYKLCKTNWKGVRDD